MGNLTRGGRLRAAMETAGLTADELAEQAGVGRATVFRLLADDRPEEPTLFKISQALGVSVDYLLGTMSTGIRCQSCGWEMEKEEDGKYRCYACGAMFDPGLADEERDFKSAEALFRAELRYKRQLSIPGGGSKSSRRKRERPKHVKPAPTTVF